MQFYQFQNFQLQYPDHWKAIEENFDEDANLIILNDDVAFWELSLYFDEPSPEELVDNAIEVFREEYDNIDIYPAEAIICGEDAIAKDLEFVYLDLISQTSLRAFRIGGISAFIHHQDVETSLETTRNLFDAITRSLSYTK